MRSAGAVALAGALLVGGCGLGDRVAGVHDAPAEQTGGAPLNEQTAQDIATRAIADASAALTGTGAAGEAARRRTLTGSALSVAEAMVSSKQTPTRSDPLTKPVVPQVLGIAKTSGWPRTMVTTTLDASSRRSLQVLVSARPSSPFVVSASVTMLSRASVPSLGRVADGIEALPATRASGLVVSPQGALGQLASAVAYPKPATPKNLATTDAFTTGLRAGAAAQAKALGTLGTYAQKHVTVPRLTNAYRLAGGGALVFGQLSRVDTITPSKSAKQLTLPADVARILGHRTTTKKVTVTYVEPVVLVVPATGQARVVGAVEQLVTAKES
ncbi:conserved exported hypothetical protein [Nostocoides japonicum T1-X7]|uniref:DUF8094 domain-containing protein n=1 Tax=Nostocoides japonicum T1-X7 TaxID=1194083 RepID=A0A077LYU6_9MICO|nr:hypothetical protein [Tetrasphaera japonica]CCH78806.1 conserved exported hypothetical protein [Tetrasphaera japonica T1-X7]